MDMKINNNMLWFCDICQSNQSFMVIWEYLTVSKHVRCENCNRFIIQYYLTYNFRYKGYKKSYIHNNVIITREHDNSLKISLIDNQNLSLIIEDIGFDPVNSSLIKKYSEELEILSILL